MNYFTPDQITAFATSVAAVAAVVAALVSIVTLGRILWTERQRRRRARLSVRFVRSGRDRALEIANASDAEARNVTVELLEPDPETVSTMPLQVIDGELPLERLSPGAAYYLGWIQIPGAANRIRVRVRWDDDADTGRTAEHPLSIVIPRPPEPPVHPWSRL